MIVRRTDRVAGRASIVEPGSAPLRLLRCGRISVDARVPPVRVDPGSLETALVCVGGGGQIRVGTERFPVEPFDLVYVPRDTHFMVWSDVDRIDLIEVSAPVEERHPLQAVQYVDELAGLAAVGPSDDARLLVLLGKRAAAGRLTVGVIVGHAGQPDRWPLVPEIDGAEIACLYSLGSDPRHAVPIMSDGRDGLGEAAVAHDGDLVVGPHQPQWDRTTATGPITMLWMLSAERELVGERFRLPPSRAMHRAF